MKHPSHRRAHHLRFGKVRPQGLQIDWRLGAGDELELLGSPAVLAELLEGIRTDLATLRAELSPAANAAVRTLVATCRGIPDHVHEVNVPLGRAGEESRWLRVSACARRASSADGSARIEGSVRDVTDEVVEAADFSGQLAAIDRSQAVIEFDLGGHVLRANENFLATFGYELEEIVGRHHSLFVPPEEHSSRAYREFWDRLARGQYDAGQYARLRADGRTVWIQATYNPIFDPAGRPFKVVKYATDITEQKLRQSDVEGQLVALDKVLAVIEFGLDGTVRTANANFLAMTGYRLEEIWGRHHSMFVDPAERESAEYAEFWRRLARGQADAGQYRRFGRDGRELWIQASYNPILGPRGEPLKIVKFATDITEQRRRHSEVESQMQAIDRAQAVLELTIDGTIANANENFLEKTGYTREQVIGRHHRILVAPEEADSPEYDAFWAQLAAGESVSGQFRRRRCDGSYVWIEASYNPILDPEGRTRMIVKYSNDVTTRKEVELALAGSEQRLRGLFELSPVGIALTDHATGEILQVNDALVACTGYPREDLAGLPFDALFATPEEAAALRERLGQDGRYGPREAEFVRRNGERYAVQIASLRILADGGRPMVWSIVEDISERKQMQSELARAALTDRLTGLANRTAFLEALQCAMRRVEAAPDERYAVLFLDFDRFKVVNDTLGHDAGDELLRQIGERLRTTLRAGSSRPGAGGNLVARLGGDEFAVLVAGARDVEHVVAIAERLLNALVVPYRIKGNDVHSSASIGIVTSDEPAQRADDVIRNADVAMYEAKRLGRARAVVFNEAMHARLARHVSVETALRQALGTPQLALVYQPIVDLANGRCTSAEALLRWRHPDLGDVSPSEFISIAEESGLIVPLGDWVLVEACRQFVAWREADPALAPRTVSVNVSRVQLALGDRLLARIREVLADTGMPPACLQLEVTEREVMRDPVGTRKLMAELRALGVRLAMDDFGTGTSSLACLRDYPFDVIKVDRSFVADVEQNPDVLAVMHATVTLVENLGMQSVAEGLEHASQVAVLQSVGCGYAQGWYFSPPVPGEAFLQTARAAGRAGVAAA
jgi:diguanylate cyclase (GGDEF)-like protein/PAS domain S-box-containing protein